MTEFVFSICFIMALPAAMVMTLLTFIFMGLLALWMFATICYSVNDLFHRTQKLFTRKMRHGCLPK